VGVSMPPSMAIPAFETKRSTPDAARAPPVTTATLLNVASAAGLLVIFDTISYTVTKHASTGLSEWLAATDVNQGIGVSVLCPAAMRTPILAGKEDTPEGRDARSAPTNSPTWSRGSQPQQA
jgi:NAD(P)-dependent dehydrogenase (short-subunit alcohol dehydrogenase family)